MSVTEQGVFEICVSRVDVSKLTAKNYTLCLDGTSCTKKSSILRGTKCLISKTQYIKPNRNSNTYFPSMIGYITAGINNLTCGGPHFEDRSPLNVLDWHILWKIFDDYLKTFGNVSVDTNNPDIRNAMLKYTSIFKAYKNSYFYKGFAQKINTIALIDSNTARCDDLRFRRGIGSDKERSLWKFYTALQNMMYAELYPDRYIDLAWFGDAESVDVISGIGKFLKFTLDVLSSRPNLDFAPLKNCRLPTVKCDYTLQNISTHVYRSIGRFGCQYLMGNEDVLRARIPSFVNATNIKHPRGNMDEPIMASTREYLFNNTESDDTTDSDLILTEDCTMIELFD
uniref:GrBNV_gp44-like protein n=1 Tax=Oryctes rhinoceros nudivirus TaxID=92521 RepID=A0A6B9QSV9_9VIRU|nr:GrBNV_gp44-like protein [Oryctes rhinoceros nudivirus]QKE59587.1 GrBNV_gp44-like protein [Oryctes rhinoceros nudivirus]UBO76534.1 GrBNV_gp44-like protein [Oryctes rhinoceros nudivirus]UBR58302.1 gp44-like protein [Oryctes rhinoceros nudivirus]WAQ80123.1 GrBNV_gp44-like protein [Oryctes rhinoceros nudivirus]